jgi:RNA polymerase sigma-70 factor (ECF subfamily)
MTAHLRMIVDNEKRPPQAAASAAVDSAEKAERFRALALPHLDDVYTLARYLLRNASDAEDAAQECYLRAFRHFDTFRGGPVKPWLLAILRNVCHAEFARRGKAEVLHADDTDTVENVSHTAWAEPDNAPESMSLARLDGETARKLIAGLPDAFRDVLVLREINDLSYRDIAEVTGAPIGTVMSRLARGRNLLRQAFLAEEKER